MIVHSFDLNMASGLWHIGSHPVSSGRTFYYCTKSNNRGTEFPPMSKSEWIVGYDGKGDAPSLCRHGKWREE